MATLHDSTSKGKPKQACPETSGKRVCCLQCPASATAAGLARKLGARSEPLPLHEPRDPSFLHQVPLAAKLVHVHEESVVAEESLLGLRREGWPSLVASHAAQKLEVSLLLRGLRVRAADICSADLLNVPFSRHEVLRACLDLWPLVSLQDLVLRHCLPGLGHGDALGVVTVFLLPLKLVRIFH